MGYTHDREENDVHELAAHLLAKFDAEGKRHPIDPELHELLCTGSLPDQLRIPADLLPFAEFNTDKLTQFGVTFEPVTTSQETLMAAIITNPMLTAMRNVAARIGEELETEAQHASFQGALTAKPKAAERKIVPFAELAKRIEAHAKNPKAKKEREK